MADSRVSVEISAHENVSPIISQVERKLGGLDQSLRRLGGGPSSRGVLGGGANLRQTTSLLDQHGRPLSSELFRRQTQAPPPPPPPAPEPTPDERGKSIGNSLMDGLKKVQWAGVAQSMMSNIQRVVDMDVAHANKVGIVQAGQSGNTLAGAGQLLDRKAEQSQLGWGIGGAIAGGAIGSFFGPFGTAIGAALGKQAGELISSLLYKGDKIKQAQTETRGALSEGWMGQYETFRQAGRLMEYKYPNNPVQSINDPREAFLSLMPYANQYGMTTQEFAGYQTRLEKMTGGRATQTDVQKVIGVSQNTGADRESLLKLAGTFGRYQPRRVNEDNKTIWGERYSEVQYQDRQKNHTDHQGYDPAIGDRNFAHNMTIDIAYSANKYLGGNNATLDEMTRSLTTVFQQSLGRGYLQSDERIAQHLTGLTGILGTGGGIYNNSENLVRVNQQLSGGIAASTSVGNASQAALYREAAAYVRDPENGQNVDDFLRQQGVDPSKLDVSTKTDLIMQSGSFNNELTNAFVKRMKDFYQDNQAMAVAAIKQGTGLSDLDAVRAYQTGGLVDSEGRPLQGTSTFNIDTADALPDTLPGGQFAAQKANIQDVTTWYGAETLNQTLEDTAEAWRQVQEELVNVLNGMIDAFEAAGERLSDPFFGPPIPPYNGSTGGDGGGAK